MEAQNQAVAVKHMEGGQVMNCKGAGLVLQVQVHSVHAHLILLSDNGFEIQSTTAILQVAQVVLGKTLPPIFPAKVLEKPFANAEIENNLPQGHQHTTAEM